MRLWKKKERNDSFQEIDHTGKTTRWVWIQPTEQGIQWREVGKECGTLRSGGRGVGSRQSASCSRGAWWMLTITRFHKPVKTAANCKHPQLAGHLVFCECQLVLSPLPWLWRALCFLSIPARAVCTQFIVYGDFSPTHICFPLKSVLFPRPTQIPEHGPLVRQVQCFSLSLSSPYKTEEKVIF